MGDSASEQDTQSKVCHIDDKWSGDSSLKGCFAVATLVITRYGPRADPRPGRH